MKRATDPDVILLAAAADPARLSILRQLSADGSVCACDFAGCCGVTQPTISHHLKVLREAGWVRAERRGSWIWYSLEPAALNRMRSIVVGIEPPANGPALAAAAASGKAGAPSRRLPVVQPPA